MVGLRLLLAVAVLGGLAACSGFETDPENRTSILEGGVFGDIRARKPKAVSNEPRGLIPMDAAPGRSAIFGPDGEAVDGTAYADGDVVGSVSAMANSGSYKLNFENAEIKDVVRAVLGDALQLNYTMTPDVAGTITISSARPVGRKDLLSILEATLSAQGFALTKTGDLYKVGPQVTGAGVVDRGAASTPGFGISVVPLRYVSVKTMSRLLGGFIVDAEGLRVDSTRNALVVSGPGGKREDVVATILSFDEDWMKDQTVGIFELARANPSQVVGELERVFDAKGSGAGVVQFKAITRLKSIMVVSRNASLVRRAESWVRRLDSEGPGGGDNVFVYRARYRDAKDLAKIVSSLLGGSLSAGPGTEEPTAIDGATDTGFELDSGGDDSGEVPEGEPPIDDVTGASGDPGSEDIGDPGAVDSGAPPDVLDLTTQGKSSSRIKISADPANNSVITYTDSVTYRKVLAALQQLDQTPMQVAINVTIAEVRLNNDLKYGVQYFVRSGDVGGGDNDGSISFREAAGALKPQIPGFNFLLGSKSSPDIIVSALDEITDVEVLSSPSLMVLENQTATLQVGDQIPVPVRSSRSVTNPDSPIVNEIEYRDTGIILKVTPRVGDNDAVTMEIVQEISNVSEGSGKNPTISKRRVASHISVIDGQTVVLAGLISATKNVGKSGLPVLSRLPGGAGDLFGSNTKGSERNELVVMIRPQIVRSGEDAQSVAEDLRSRMWAIGERERPNP